MRKLLAVHLLCMVVFSQGLFDIIDQDGGKKINYYRKNGKKIELSRQEYYYNSGNMKAEGNYSNGEQEGRWTKYYENSQIKEQGNYKSGRKVNRWISYYDNGTKKSEGSYKNGELVKLNDSSSDNIWQYGEKFICKNRKEINSNWVDDRECDCEVCEDEPFMNK